MYVEVIATKGVMFFEMGCGSILSKSNTYRSVTVVFTTAFFSISSSLKHMKANHFTRAVSYLHATCTEQKTCFFDTLGFSNTEVNRVQN